MMNFLSKINRLVIALLGVLVLTISNANAGTAYTNGRAFLKQGSPTGGGKVYVASNATEPAASAYKAVTSSTSPAFNVQVAGNATFHYWAVANAGYIFTGWYTAEGALQSSGAAHISKAVTAGTAGTSDTHAYADFYASFIKQIQLSFVTPTNGSFITTHCGSEVTPAYSSFTTEGKVVLTALPADGYKLRGWYTTTNGGTTKNYFAFGNSCEPNFTSNVTIGAEFVPDDGKATFWIKGTNKIFNNLTDANTAAAAASSKMIVVVSDGVVGAGTYTISSGVTLLIPYEETYTLMTKPNVKHITSATAAAKTPSIFRKLTLASGATINVSGNICIGGSIASVNGGNPSSFPTGPVGMLDLSRGGTINLASGSNLYAWGYVKGQDMDQGNNTAASGVGEINAASGATVWEDYQVGEWRGGTASSTIYNNKSSWKFFPFQSYSIQNIEAPVNYAYGSTLKCFWTIFGNGSVYDVNFPLIASSGSLFKLASGGTVRKWYDPTTDHVCFELGGTAALDALTLTVMGESVSSKDYNLPIPANLKISLKSGNTLTVSKPMTMHAGSVVEVQSGARLNVSSKVYLYDADDWDTYCMYKYYYRTYFSPSLHFNRGEGTSKTTLEDATLIVDGTVNLGAQMLYATAHGANICGNGGGTFIYNTLPSNTTMTQCKELKDNVSVNIRSANLHNDNGTYTKGIASTTFKNVNGRWFTNAASTAKANHTYDFTYIKSGDVYGTGGTNATVSACYSKDKTGLYIQNKWANIKKDVCDNWWVGIDDSHLYNWSRNSAWHQYIKAKTKTEGSGEEAVTTDIYAGSDGKLLYNTECEFAEQPSSIDGQCRYDVDGTKQALVDESFVTVTANDDDDAYHKSDDASKYYVCFSNEDGCVWHPAVKSTKPTSGTYDKAYTVNSTNKFIWYNNEWLPVEYDSSVGLFYSLSSTNVKIYYDYVNSEWVLATPVAEVTTSAGTEQVFSLANAITKAKAGGTNVTIRLMKNLSGTFTYDGTNNCGLDLNGFTFSSSSSNMIKVNNASATIIIKDQSAAGTGKIQAKYSRSDDKVYGLNVTNGHIVLNSGTVHIENTHASQGACGVYVVSGMKFTMNGGTLEVVSKGESWGVNTLSSTTSTVTINGGTIDASTTSASGDNKTSAIYGLGGNIIVNGGTLNGRASATYARGIYLNSANPKLTVNGGTITATAPNTIYGLHLIAGATATINGGTITATATGGTVRGILSYGTLTMNGGTVNANAGGSDSRALFLRNNTSTINAGTVINATAASNAYGIYYDNGTPTVTVNNGTFTVSTTSTTGAYGVFASKGTGTINDGIFTVTAKTTGAEGMHVETANTPKLTLNGGKFMVKNSNGSADGTINNTGATLANFSMAAGYFNVAPNGTTNIASGKEVKDVDNVKEKAIYDAGYRKKIAGTEYQVTWKNHKGDVVGTSMVESGKVPVWTGGEVNVSDANSTREHNGWCTAAWNGGTSYLFPTALPAIVNADVTYFAHYNSIYAEVTAGGTTTRYNSAQGAWTAAMTHKRATIRILSNIGTDASVGNMTQMVFNPSNDSSIIVLDLNGHSWTMGNHVTASENKSSFLKVCPSRPGCQLIVTDNSASGNGYLLNKWNRTDGVLNCAIVETGELLLQGGALKAGNTATATYYTEAVRVQANAKFSMLGGAVYAEDLVSPRALKVDPSGVVEVTGGTVKAKTTNNGAYGLLLYGNGTVGGDATIEAEAVGSNAYGTQCEGTLNVEGGTFKATAASNARGFYAVSGGVIHVDTVSVITEAKSGHYSYGGYVTGTGSEIEINDGTFELKGTAERTMVVYALSSGVATINNGTFTVNGGTSWSFAAFVENSGTININGGEFTISQASGGNKEGIRVYPGGTCNITGGTFTVTTIGSSGGNALHAYGGTTNISGNPVFNAHYGVTVADGVVANGATTTTVVIDGGTYNTQSFAVNSKTATRADAYYTGTNTGDVTVWDGKFKSQLAGYNVLDNSSPSSCLKIRGGWFSNNSSGKIATGSGNYVVSPSTVTTLTSSDQPEYDNGYRYRVNTKYSVTWKDGATTIKEEYYNRNEIPSFDDYDPSTAADTYVLTGWTPTPGPIQSDQVYTAVKTKYEAEVIEGDTTAGYKFENFMDAWNAAKNLPVAKVKLLSNVSMSTQLVLTPDSAAGSKPLTLDLNNHTLAYTGTADRFIFVEKEGSKLIITDNSVAKGGKVKVDVNRASLVMAVASHIGEVELQEGEIFTRNSNSTAEGWGVYVCRASRFTMTGGKVTAYAKTKAKGIHTEPGTPTVNITGGSVLASTEYDNSGTPAYGANAHAIRLVSGATVKVSGTPTLKAVAASEAYGVYADARNSSFDISGGTIKAITKSGNYAVCVRAEKTAESRISDGTFIDSCANSNAHAVWVMDSAYVAISGGTFRSVGTTNQAQTLLIGNWGNDRNARLDISDGTFLATGAGGNIEAIRMYPFGILNITGGTFSTTGVTDCLQIFGGKTTISGNPIFRGYLRALHAAQTFIGTEADTAKVVINGGTFISKNSNYAVRGTSATKEVDAVTKKQVADITINGGYFYSKVNGRIIDKAGDARIVLHGGKYNEISGQTYHYDNINTLKSAKTGISNISETTSGDTTYVYELLTKFAISWRGGSSYSRNDSLYSGVMPSNNECTSFIRNDSTFYFTGWSPTPTPVAGDATYQAVGDYYEAEVKIGSGAWTRYTDFLEAWDTVQVHANCSIRLLSSLTLLDKILYKPTEANARTVFDLNNCTLTAGGTANSFLEFNKEDAILTITDDSSEKGGKISISRTLASSSYALYIYNGELVMKGGHIYSENNQDDASWHPAIAIYVGSRAGAKLTMTDGTVEAEGKYCIYPVYTYGTTDISGGTVKATASGITSTGVGSATGVYVVNGTTRIRGTANIEVSSTSSATGAQAGAWISTDTTTVQRGTLNIEGGTFDVKSSVRAAYAIQTSATIKEYGGKYCKSHGTANVSGGTFSVKCSAATAEQVMALQCYDARVFDEATPHHMLAQESSVVNISGGTFTVDTRNNGAFVANAGNIDILRSWGTLNVTGGTFTIYQHTAPVGIGTYLGKTTVSGSPVFNVIAYENAKGILAAPWNHSTYCDADATKNLAEIEVNGGTFNVKATNSTVIGAQAAGSISAAGGTGVAGYAMSGKITINDGTFVCTAPSTIRCLLQYAPVSGDYGTAVRTLIVKGGKYRAQIASVDANGTISGVINTTDGNNIDNGGSSNKIVDLAGGYFLNPHELNHNVADSCMVTEITSAAIDPEYNNGYRYRIDTDIKAIVTAGGVVRKYHDIKKALDYAKTVAAPTITIMQDGTFVTRWNLSNAIDGWQGVLDLNGHTVTGTGSVYHYAIIDLTKAGTKLTIRDSSVGQTGQLRHVETEDSHWGINVDNGAELKLESGTIYVKNNKTVTGYTCGICVNTNGGTFTQTGGKVEVHAPQNIYGVQVGSASSGTASVNISGGEVEVASDNDPENLGDVVYALFVNRASTVTINGTASISATADSLSYGLWNNAASITTTIGGSASITASARKTAYAVTQGAAATGTVTINGNAVISAETTVASAYGINNAAGSTTISGSVSIDAQASTSAYGISATGGSITVSGGTIETNAVSNGASIALYVANTTASVSGGTFTSSCDYASASNVSPIRSGVGSTVTINGGTFNGVGFQAVSIRGGSTTINDGTFTSTTGIRAMDWADGTTVTGTLTVNGGTFTCTGPVIHSSSMNNGGRNAHSEITVNGGKFKSTGSEIVKMTAAPAGTTASTITIQGGYFNETDGTTFKTQIGNYVSNPYEVFTLEAGDPEIANGYSYEVCQHRVAKVESGGSRTYYTTIKAALDYAKTVADPTITLLDNCTLTEGNYTINPGNWTGTLDLNNFTLTPTIDAGTGRAFTIGGSGTKFIVTDNSEDKGGKIYYKDNWSATNIIYFVVASGEMELAGGTLYVEDTNDSRAVIGFVVDGNPSQFTQSGGTFTVKSNGSAKGYYGKGTATFKGGAMNVESTAQAIGLYPHESTSVLNVSGTFELNVTSSTADSYGVLVKNSGATGTISGGKFKFNQNTMVAAQSSGSLTINGGYFCEKSGTTYRDQIDDYLGTGRQVIDLAAGDAMYDAPNNYRYTVTDAVAKVQIGSTVTYHTGMGGASGAWPAVNAAETASTLTMLKDVTVTGQMSYTNSQNCTLDLNGHTITSNTSNRYPLYVNKTGVTFTITDGTESKLGKLVLNTTYSDNVIFGACVKDGALQLEAGTIEVNSGSQTTCGVSLYAAGSFTMNGGTIHVVTTSGREGRGLYSAGTTTINDGSIFIEAAGEGYGIKRETGGSITVNGGKFNITSTGSGSTAVVVSATGVTIEGGYYNINNNLAACTTAPYHVFDLAGQSPYLYEVAQGYTLTWTTDGDPLTGTYTSGTTKVGTTIVAPSTPTKTGYTFNGWSPSAPAATMPAANTTYTATWTINSYDVTFNMQGHGAAVASQSINYNGLVTEPATPTEANYVFGGWYKEAGCTNAWNFASDHVTAATTLYAKWIAAEAEVSFNGGAATPYTTLAEAFTAAKGGNKALIKVLKDVPGISTALTYNPSSTYSCTLDLNGYTISGTVTGLLTIYKSGSQFTITDNSGANPTGQIRLVSSGNANRYCVYLRSGKLTLEKGTIYAENTSTTDAGTSIGATAVYVNNSSSYIFTMNNGSLEAKANYRAHGVYSYGKTDIKGGTIKATIAEGGTSNAYGVYSAANKTTITGSPTITVEAPTAAYGAFAAGNSPDSKTGAATHGTVDIQGGTFNVTATAGAACAVNANAGRRKISSVADGYATGNYVSHGKVFVSDGTFNVSGTSTVYGVNVTKATYDAFTDANGVSHPAATAYGYAEISGGKFILTTGTTYAANETAPVDSLIITGGYFSTSKTSASKVLGSKYIYSGNASSLYRVFDLTAAQCTAAGMPANSCKVARFYTITYNKGANGTGTIAAEYKAHGDDFTLSSSTFTRTGYTQTGWSTSDGGAKAYELGGTYADNADITLYPFWTINTNTVTYSAPSNGNYTIKVGSGTASSASKNADYAQTITIAATPSTGYHFTSWTITKTSDGTNVTGSVSLSSSTNKNATFTMPDYGVTVTAAFAIDTYAISYAAGTYGSGSLSGGTKTYGVAYALSSSSSAFTRTGYTYDGWSTNAAGSSKDYNLGGSYTTNAEQTFYPHWVATNYTISYTLNGGSVAVDNPTSYTIESAAITLNNPTKTGYTFAGWTGTGLDAATTTVTIAAGSTGNRSYTATWTANTYSVRFNKNDEGATGTMSNEAFTYDVEKALTANAFTKTGYNFDGWATSAGGDVVYTDGQSVSNLSSTQGAVVDLYAKWSAATYTVTLNQNGATTSGSTSVTMTYGSAEHSGITNPKKTGYSFKGWYTSAGGGTRIIKSDGTLGTKTGYVEGEVWVRTTATTLYAGWTQTVKLDKNGGSADGSAASVRYKSSSNLTITAPTREGFSIEGYYAEPACTHKVVTAAGALVNYSGYVESDKWVHAGATTLYTKWTEDTHTVTVAAGANGSASPASVSGVGITTASGDITATPNTGYHFVNWTIPSGVTAASTYTASSNPIRINATADDKTITANFAVNSYDVTLNTNGGTINAGNVTSYTYGVGATLPTDVTKAGYTFAGWFDNSELTGSAVTTISTTATGDKEYWAKWTSVALTFTGATNSSWNTASNWTPACVPTSAHDIYIQKPCSVDIEHAAAKSIVIRNGYSGYTGKLTVGPNMGLDVAGTITKTTNGSNSLATNESDLVLESSTAGNASLIFNNNNACKATVEMYSKASVAGNTWNWQYVGTPFTGSIPLYNYYGGYMYKWYNDGASNGWSVVHGSDVLDPFVGYCLTQASPTTHIMSGTLVATDTKDQTITMGASTDKVLANSWTAPISIASFTESTFTSTPATIYLFNTGSAENGSSAGEAAGTYITVPISSAPYTGNGLIAPMQGFFVTTVTGSAGKITMKYNELVRPAGSHTDIVAGPMKSPMRDREDFGEPDVMKISAKGSIYKDRVVILAREDFSEGFDNGWDGEKKGYNSAAPAVFVINEEGKNDAVSAIPEYEGTLVGFRAGTDNEYTLTFEYNGDEVLYLNDLKAQMSTVIANEQTYTFMTEDGDSEVRFIISHTPIHKITTGIDEVVGGAKVRKIIINDKVYIIRNGRLYNVTGALVK